MTTSINAAMMPPIEESGMIFGPYPAHDCFYIEKSGVYQSIQNGVKMAEFALLRARADNPSVVWIVEAKSSSPKAGKPDFDEYIEEIRAKFVNAITLIVATCLGRHPQAGADLPQQFQSLDLAQAGFRLILVINGAKAEWLPPLQDALNKAMLATAKAWALAPTAVAVMNETGAMRHELILRS